MCIGYPDEGPRTSDGARWPAGGARGARGTRQGLVRRRRFVGGRGYRARMTVIGEEQATEHIHGICLKTGPPRRVGAELEWLVRDAHDPALPVSAERIAAAVTAFGAIVTHGDAGGGP